MLALAVGLVACGSEEAERQILIEYVQQMQKLDSKNKQIVETIEHLRKPLSEISEQDLAKARATHQRLRLRVARARARRSGL